MGWNTDKVLLIVINHLSFKPLPPKRPLTAFFLYKEDLYLEIKKNNPDAKAVEITRIIANKWKDIDENTRLAYEKRAEQAKAKFQQEMKEYEEKYGSMNRNQMVFGRNEASDDSDQDDRANEKPNLIIMNKPQPPLKPLTAFFHYRNAKIDEVKMANPEAKITQLTMIIAQMWKDLDQESKLEYEKAYEQDKARYEKELKEYEEKYGKTEKKQRPLPRRDDSEDNSDKNEDSNKQNAKNIKNLDNSASDPEDDFEEPSKKKKIAHSE